jgi:chromosome segregation ATPase
MPKNASKKSSSSSSSDDDSEDELIKQQLREATISFEQITSKNAEKSQSKEAIDKKSKRYPVENENQQEEDDNSFKMTPEFQVTSNCF